MAIYDHRHAGHNGKVHAMLVGADPRLQQMASQGSSLRPTTTLSMTILSGQGAGQRHETLDEHGHQDQGEAAPIGAEQLSNQGHHAVAFGGFLVLLVRGPVGHSVQPVAKKIWNYFTSNELRFFGGLSVEETAEVLKISAQSVMRDWKTARSWLLAELAR